MMSVQARPMKPTFKKVKVVYYLSRNGHLEHPHYMEITHLAHQHLRLKDVMDRLIALRGKTMRSLYSWSCKRSYKNGYVWNDLAENDVIYPSEGAEYVLKGSEIAVGCTEKLQLLQLGQDSSFYPKRKVLATKRQWELQEMMNGQFNHHIEEKEEIYNLCSRGVSTDDAKDIKLTNSPKNEHNDQTLDILSNNFDDNNTSKPLDDVVVGNEPMLSRNSMLQGLISCNRDGNGSSSFRKGLPPLAARKSCSNDGAGHQKATRVDDEVVIKYMSENPRLLGNFGTEEKEYFSGSIVEAMASEERIVAPLPCLKRSSSYHQDRSKGAELEEAEKEEKKKKDKGMKGKCIPRKKKTSSKKVTVT